MIAGIFKLEPGNPGWLPRADRNADGQIDVRDILMAAQAWNRHCPTYFPKE